MYKVCSLPQNPICTSLDSTAAATLSAPVNNKYVFFHKIYHILYWVIN